VRRIPTPSGDPEGLAWDGTHLWSNDFAQGMLYRLDPVDGRVVGSYTGGGLPVQPEGLCWDGSRLWTCDWLTGRISRVRVSPTGVVVEESFDKPKGAGKTVGLEWDGTNLWLACFPAAGEEKSQLWALDPQTLAVRRFLRLPVYWAEDLAWDGHHLWSVDWFFRIGFAIDTATGDTLHTYRAPAPNPVGQAWDGTHLWLSAASVDSIYALDISGARPTPVQPTSWGAVKRRFGGR
jgi:sugar lactone lactonase YvrE